MSDSQYLVYMLLLLGVIVTAYSKPLTPPPVNTASKLPKTPSTFDPMSSGLFQLPSNTTLDKFLEIWGFGPFKSLKQEKNKNSTVFKCYRGTICCVTIPDYYNLTSLYLIHADSDENKFLEPTETNESCGVPMMEGNFNFNWTFFEQTNTFTELGFQIEVSTFPEPNHFIRLTLLDPSAKEFITKLLYRSAFISVFSKSLEIDEDQVSIFKINEIKNKTRIDVFFNYLPTERCEWNKINQFRKAMFTANGRPNVNFLKAMDKVFHVRSATFIPTGPCAGTVLTAEEKVPSYTFFSAEQLLFITFAMVLLFFFAYYVVYCEVKHHMKPEVAEKLIGTDDISEAEAGQDACQDETHHVENASDVHETIF